MEVCPTCGLPKELCVCESIAKSAQKIIVRTESRRWGKLTTVIDGLNPKQINLTDLLKKLKGRLACGGTVKDNTVELQGDHRKSIIRVLTKLGFEEGQIEVR